MAPHIEQDYHSRGDPDTYALRSFKHKENNRLQPRGTNVSKTKRKEHFFSYLGLQIKKNRSEMSKKNLIMSTSVSSGMSVAALRECRVIILGAKCSLCYKCFKCKTDLKVHCKLKHKSDIKLYESKSQTIENRIETSQCLNLERCDTAKNVKIKPQRLRLTLKIGDEIVASKSMKRKYLRRQMIDSFAQTENELITDENGYEDYIDPRDSPDECCKANRYSASNNVTTKLVLPEENIGDERIENSRGAKESREVSCTQEDCSMICYFPGRTTILGKTSTVAVSEMLPSVYWNDVSISNNSFKTLESNGSNTNKSFKSLSGDINVPSKQTMQFTKNNNETIHHIHDNNNVESINMSNVYILPLVHVSDKNNPIAGTRVQLMIESTPVYLDFRQNQQQGPHIQRKQHQEEQFQGAQVPNQQKKHIDNSDDIQEVLIIGGRENTEFNHESPTRLQQEKLSYVTIEEMTKMQVSSSRTNNGVDSAKGKKAMNEDATDQCAKEKKRRIDMNPNEGKLSSMKRTSYSDAVKTCAPNNGKEDFMCKNTDVSTENKSSDVLHCGINYEEFEINNNVDCVRESLLSSSWKKAENVPPLIDLVNDE